MVSQAIPSLAMVDLVFPVIGSRLPTDHGYALYGAMSRLLPCLHDGSVPFGFVPITGAPVGRGLLQIEARQSRLRLRVPAHDIPRVLPLAGKRLEMDGHGVRLAVPQVEALQPVTELIARTVAINYEFNEQAFLTVEGFLQSARRQLAKLAIKGICRVPEGFDRDGRKVPIRRVVRIKDVRIVCFPLLVDGLKPDESLRLQEQGIGGRRRMGCGVFIPARSQESDHAE
jgi:CRISPR-associated protein Cas6